MKIAVIIPSYRVSQKVLSVIDRIGPEVSGIFVVDDKCPEGSGELVKKQCRDPRVKVIFQEKNEGVGGATLRGFLAAARDFQVLVKLDGDGQMDPSLISRLVRPILQGKADYCKGNRFHSPRALAGMPLVRVVGNAGMGFLAKITTGYWNISDPTNGFLALQSSLLPYLDTDRIAKRYFFENDLLFRLGLVRAAVADMPMQALYADEKSGLSVTHSLFSFPGKFFIRFLKRLGYRYFMRDFNIGSVLLAMGSPLFVFGLLFGLYHWLESNRTGVLASSGTVMLSALPTLLGFQMLTFAMIYDVLLTPRDPIHPSLEP